MESFSFSIPQSVIYGPGTIGKLPELALKLKRSKALIVSGPRDWKDRCDAAGAVLVNEGVMANNAPDDDAIEACKDLGAALA